MRQRVRHAARFAIATLIAVYVVGAVWELLAIYVFRNLADGSSLWATFRFNEQVWRTIAIIEGIVVFLLKLGDVSTEPPSWLYAWMSGGWVAISTVAIGTAVDQRRWTTAIVIAIGSIAAWYLARDRIPGRPGTTEFEIASMSATDRDVR